ncbi:hypothetical protein HHK36_017627 [Tetracentron sinense]|uniref:SET domain-containing protein n=1 Tax=Tetracentron sinense TaxID=13715 RepID=A0A835DAI8_TETSI|nr:hypothetical protein HHK36_017627 [Tetracentron sinense]
MSPIGCFRRWASPLKKLQHKHKLLIASSFTITTTTTTTADKGEKPSRPFPPPIRVSLTESAGRGVFATRSIGSGDLIHTAKSLLSHPSLSLLHTVCYFCLRIKTTSISIDQAVFFCSEECREHSKGFYEIEKKADWSAFDEQCRMRGLKYPLLVKRLACMVLSGIASSDSLDILQPASLSPGMIVQMEEEFGSLRYTLTKAGIMDDQMAFLTKQWYTGVLARIRINAFRIELVGGSYEDLLLSAAASVEAEAAVGNAVYMLPSFYNHDCDPNVHIVWIDNVDARLKALRNIETDEELRICYIDASMNHDARQALLFEGFGFQCNCLRCLSGD